MDQRLLALVRDRRRLRAGVVACEREHAAVRRGAGVVRVLERVARAVDAGPLAVPDPEHTIVLRARIQPRLLRSPHRGGGEVFVHAGLEADAVLFEQRARLPQRHVVRAERRAAVARDESARVETRAEIALALEHRQPHERLDAAQIHAARGPPVAVVELVLSIEIDGEIRHLNVSLSI